MNQTRQLRCHSLGSAGLVMVRTNSKDVARERPRRARPGTGAGRDPHDKRIEDARCFTAHDDRGESLHQLEAVRDPRPAAVGEQLDLGESESAAVDVPSDTALSPAGPGAGAGAGAGAGT